MSAEVQFVMFTDCTKQVSDLIHRQDNLWDFYTNKRLNSIYRRKFVGLDKTSSVAYNSNETKLATLFFFTFRWR